MGYESTSSGCSVSSNWENISWHWNILYEYKNKNVYKGPSWPWSSGSWIYNYLSNQCLSPLMLWVRISNRARCTTLWDKVYQWLATGRGVSPGSPVSSTNKTDCHDISEMLLKVALNTIKSINKSIKPKVYISLK